MSQKTAVTDVRSFRLEDITDGGDCFDDPAWLELVGISDQPVTAAAGHLSGAELAEFNKEHLRDRKGKFADHIGDAIASGITAALDEFSREQLRQYATKKRGLVLPRGASREEIAKRLLAGRQVTGAVGPEPAGIPGRVALSRLKVAELRSLADAHGVRLPAKARKADIVDLLSPQASADGGDLRGRVAEVERRLNESADEVQRIGLRHERARLLAEAAGRPAPDPIDLARARQTRIDALRARADALAELEEVALVNGGSPAAIASRMGNAADRGGFADDPDMAEVIRAARSGDTGKIAAAVDVTAGRLGLVRTSSGDAVIPYDPATMRSLGRSPQLGTFVHVARPGYQGTVDGERLQLVKAVTEEATPEETASVRSEGSPSVVVKAAPAKRAVRTPKADLGAAVDAIRGMQADLGTASREKVRAQLRPLTLTQLGEVWRRLGHDEGLPAGTKPKKIDYMADHLIGMRLDTQAIVDRRGEVVGLPKTELNVVSSGIPSWSLPEGVSTADAVRVKRLVDRGYLPPHLGLGSEPESYAQIVAGQSLKLAEADRAWLKSMVLEHPDLYLRSLQGRMLRENFVDDAKRHGITDVRAYKKEFGDKLQELVAGKPIGTRIGDEAALRSLLNDGRFKTSFDKDAIRANNMHAASTARAQAERLLWGYPEDTDPAARPVYGYVMPNGVMPSKDKSDELLSYYGRIQIVLKPQVANRATVSFADSLDGFSRVRPSPIDDVSWESAPLTPDINVYKAPGFTDNSYIEAQIHGGVKTSDIAEVVFPSTPEVETQKALEKAGIPWRTM